MIFAQAREMAGQRCPQDVVSAGNPKLDVATAKVLLWLDEPALTHFRR